ncbi:MAG: adenylate/guanylate cyclase domain-containing protein [Treponema sp.]|nr:adenylate/guanylate cyclase domain-containing protein [Treponema sp.]
MKAKDFFFKYYGFFFGLFCVAANVFAVLLADKVDFVLPETEAVLLWTGFISSHKILTNVLSVMSYFIPSVICVIYIFQGFHFKKSDKKYIKIAVHIPGVFALVGTLGWVINFFVELVFLVYLNLQTGVDFSFIIISSASSMMFLAMLSFTIIYFTLETLNRNLILPHFYPDGNISDTQRMSISSIRNMFLFYFFATAFFPTAYLGIRIFMIVRYGLVVDSYSDLIVAMELLLLGFILTLIFSGFFSKPLKKLTAFANLISEGHYDCRTQICSNDEMGVLGDSFNAMAKSLKEKEFMHDTFGKIVTPQVRDYLLNGNVALGGENLSVTVMFCDIRGFTTLSENMPPEKIVSLLNLYFTGLEKCITAHNGVINKYIGDAVMALFGAPVKLENHAKDAFEAALDMRKALEEMNRDFEAKGFPALKFGIGLHSGNVLAGNIGAANRIEYTVIGDTVNTASRIEGLCKTYKTDLLISQSTADALKGTSESAGLIFVDDADIRGRSEKVKLYTI